MCCFCSITNQSRLGNGAFPHFYKNKQNSTKKSKEVKPMLTPIAKVSDFTRSWGRSKKVISQQWEIYITAMQTTGAEESIWFSNHFWSPGHGAFTG